MDNLTIQEASRLVGRSRDTIWRWKRDSGVDITNRTELLNFSARQDYRARGASRQRSRRRQLAVWDRATAASEIAARFRGVTDPDKDELPPPFNLETADRLMRRLREIKAGFTQRAAQLESLGVGVVGEVQIGIATSELEEIQRVYQILNDIFAEYPD